MMHRRVTCAAVLAISACHGGAGSGVSGGATVHAMALANDAVYLSVFRDSKAAILRFAR